MALMTFADAICDRIKDLEAFTVVINDRQVSDITPNGHPTNIRPEECVVLACTPSAGVHLRRLKDGQEISLQWHAIGSFRIIEQ